MQNADPQYILLLVLDSDDPVLNWHIEIGSDNFTCSGHEGRKDLAFEVDFYKTFLKKRLKTSKLSSFEPN